MLDIGLGSKPQLALQRPCPGEQALKEPAVLALY